MDDQLLNVIGTTGLKSYSGVIDEEWLLRLRGRNAQKIYREMIDNSSSIATSVNLIGWLIRQASWSVTPSIEGDDSAIAEALDTELALEDMSGTFGDIIDEALSMIWSGYAPMEIIYKIRRGPDQEDSSLRSKYSDGKFGWRKISMRSQDTVDRWLFDEDGGLAGLVQVDHCSDRGSSMEAVIPIEKLLLFRISKHKDNPEGKSILRPAVVPYLYSKRVQEFEAIGVERNLAGMPVMEVPAELLSVDASENTKKLRKQFEKFITQVRKDERYGGLIPSSVKPDGSPSGFKFSLMQGGGGKVMDTDVIIKRYRNDILRIFMTQFLALGSDKAGSYALSTSQTGMFSMAIGAIMDSITDVINRFMIPRRQKLNGIDPSLSPKMTHGEIQGPDLAKIAAYIQALSNAGSLTPNNALERRLMEMADLPAPPDDEELIADVEE